MEFRACNDGLHGSPLVSNAVSFPNLVSFKLCGDRAFALEVEGFFVAESGDRSLFVVDTVDGQNPALPIIRNIP